MKMTKITLQSIVVDRPEPTTRAKQHMCMDKGYDYSKVYELLEDYGYTVHILLRGEHRVNCKRYRARHWIVERTYYRIRVYACSRIVFKILINIYGKYIVYYDDGSWSPEACNSLRLKHTLHNPFVKSVIEKSYGICQRQN